MITYTAEDLLHIADSAGTRLSDVAEVAKRHLPRGVYTYTATREQVADALTAAIAAQPADSPYRIKHEVTEVSRKAEKIKAAQAQTAQRREAQAAHEARLDAITAVQQGAPAGRRPTYSQISYAADLGADLAEMVGMDRDRVSGVIDGLKASAAARRAGARLDVDGQIWE